MAKSIKDYEKALEKVVDGKMTARDAAKKFGLSDTMICKYLNYPLPGGITSERFGQLTKKLRWKILTRSEATLEKKLARVRKEARKIM